MSDFNTAIELVLSVEGGYVFDKKDPGGETKWGISKRSYPHLNIKDLTRDQAKLIYFRDFWNANRYGEIESQLLANKILDMCVNMGAHSANSYIQMAIWTMPDSSYQIIAADGSIGSKTLELTNRYGLDLISPLIAYCVMHYTIIKYTNRENYEEHKNGWFKRAYTWLGKTIKK